MAEAIKNSTEVFCNILKVITGWSVTSNLFSFSFFITLFFIKSGERAPGALRYLWDSLLTDRISTLESWSFFKGHSVCFNYNCHTQAHKTTIQRLHTSHVHPFVLLFYTIPWAPVLLLRSGHVSRWVFVVVVVESFWHIFVVLWQL